MPSSLPGNCGNGCSNASTYHIAMSNDEQFKLLLKTFCTVVRLGRSVNVLLKCTSSSVFTNLLTSFCRITFDKTID